MNFAVPVPTDEEKAFYVIDRSFYTRLVMNLQRDYVQALRIMALWYWLDSSIVMSLYPMCDGLVDAFYREGETILTALLSETPPSESLSKSIALTNGLMINKIDPMPFHEIRNNVLQGLENKISHVCSVAFHDLIKFFEEMSQLTVGNLTMAVIDASCPQNHPILPSEGHLEVGESSNIQARDDNKTMFMTFSKGYPVNEDELRTYLVRHYGEVIESVQFEAKPPNIQPLWARVVFESASTVNRISDGCERAMFTVRGKHVLARRFVTKT